MATDDMLYLRVKSPDSTSEADPRRRDFLNIAAVAFPAVGGAVAIVLPLINQMNPSADVLAQSTTEIDLSKIAAGPGRSRRTFRKQPLFVRNLTPKEIAEAERGAGVARCAIRRRWSSGPRPARRTG